MLKEGTWRRKVQAVKADERATRGPLGISQELWFILRSSGNIFKWSLLLAGRIDCYYCLKILWGRLFGVYYYLVFAGLLSFILHGKIMLPCLTLIDIQLGHGTCGPKPLGRHTSPSHWHLTDIRFCYMACFSQWKVSKSEMTALKAIEEHGSPFSLCHETSMAQRVAASSVRVLQWRCNWSDLNRTCDGHVAWMRKKHL